MTWTLLLCVAALGSVFELRLAAAIPPPPAPLDCTSQLRLFYPQLFTHCNTECQYSEWSDWEVVAGSNANVTTAQCPSGEAYTETRNRSSSTFAHQILGCTNTTQSRQICMPDRIDLLIMSLGLGSSGNTIDSAQIPSQPRPPVPGPPVPGPPVPGPPVPGPPAPGPPAPGPGTVFFEDIQSYFKPPFIPQPPVQQKPQYCTRQRVCHSHGKRSSKRETPQEAVRHHTPKSSPRLSVSEEAPLPFDWNQHHHRFRRQATCGHQDTQYILFLLDTSGSIGSVDFHRMTREISRLNLFYCRPIKVAVMTFSSTFHVEFCFNCHDNTCNGRFAVSEAMAGIRYRGGWTRTGGATRCACDFLLSQSCGLPTDAECISVVYITDGRSNGRHRVCDEVRCLHSRSEVETFAIGIGNYDEDELNCIADASGDTSIFAGKKFEFTDFDDFVNNLSAVERKLMESAQLPANENKYRCVNPSNPSEKGGATCTWPAQG